MSTDLRLHEEKERGLKSQLDDLKKKASETQASLLAEAKSQAESTGRLSDGGSKQGKDAASLRDRLEEAIAVMSEGLVERDTEIRLLLLAALAGEHILYIGPPGTAKSELGRRLSRLCHGKYFERLLTRFSVPEELFGPLSMRALEEDKYIRQTEGYLPEATVAFVDEIFKANSAILNTLLTILNERLFDNGAHRIRVPLLCLVGASNELPESEELDALYDRFLIRRQVNQVSPAGLIEMLSLHGEKSRHTQLGALAHPGAESESSLDQGDNDISAENKPLLMEEDFFETRKRAEALVEVTPSVLNLIADLRAFLQEKCEPPVYVSDRRLVKAVGLMQVAAYTAGRSRLENSDCLLLRHVLWQRPEEGERIYEWLLTSLASDDGLKQMQYLLSGMFGRACKALGKPEEVAGVAEELGQLREALTEKLVGVYGAAENGLPSGANMWLGQDDSAAIASALLPKLEKTKEEVERLLFEVVTLEVRILVGHLHATSLAMWQKINLDFFCRSCLVPHSQLSFLFSYESNRNGFRIVCGTFFVSLFSKHCLVDSCRYNIALQRGNFDSFSLGLVYLYYYHRRPRYKKVFLRSS